MTYDPKQLVFTDCETTGLDIFNHEVWEMAFILWDDLLGDWHEHTFKVWPTNLVAADPISLAINGFYTRPELQMDGWNGAPGAPEVAEWMAYNLAGKHLVGACVWFDERFYQKFMLTHDHVPTWHYHLIDIEALAIGYTLGGNSVTELPLPWRSDWLAQELGMARPAMKERHTALGDAREVKQVWELIMGLHDGGEGDGRLDPEETT